MLLILSPMHNSYCPDCGLHNFALCRPYFWSVNHLIVRIVTFLNLSWLLCVVKNGVFNRYLNFDFMPSGCEKLWICVVVDCLNLSWLLCFVKNGNYNRH